MSGIRMVSQLLSLVIKWLLHLVSGHFKFLSFILNEYFFSSLRAKLPADPFEAELLAMAGALVMT